MDLRVVFVEPLYPINVGYVARVAGNFGVKKLYFVKPRCMVTGPDAIKYSKHSRKLLEDAKTCKSLEEAISGTFSIGTSGIWHKSHSSFYDVYTPEGISNIIRENGHEKVALVLGRDDLGLDKEELRLCDAVSFIPSNEDYPILNVSHALAIMLYELYDKEPTREKFNRIYATKSGEETFIRQFERFLAGREGIRDRKSVAMSLKHIIRRANPTKKEINALNSAFSIAGKGRVKKSASRRSSSS